MISLIILLAACAAGGSEAPITSTTSVSAPETSQSGTGSSPSTTTVLPPTDPAALLVVGDWGSGDPAQREVADAMSRYAAQTDPHAILTTGDNFYNDDWELLMEPFGWVSESGIPFWITWGNHDVESQARIAAVNEAFADPPRWAVHEWGLVDVIVLDSNQITSPRQALFFLDAMGESGRPTIVAMHHPPYSCAHHGSTTDLVNQVVGILDDDVVLVLGGHDHVYQRFEHDGVAYVVTGGGGAPTYELSDCPLEHPEPLAGEATHHFLAIRQTGTELHVTAIDAGGDTIDEFEVPLP